MEVLNNIWIAISTPNEGLVNILLIPAGIIENYLMLSLFSNILNIESSRNQKLIYILLMSFVSLLTIHVIPNPFNLIFNYGFMIILSINLFKISKIKGILTISSSIIFALVGMLTLNPYLTIFNINSSQLNLIPMYKLGYLIIMYLIVSLLI